MVSLFSRAPSVRPGRAQFLKASTHDWDAEIEMFKQRSLAPNQLVTLRRAEEADVHVGQVLFSGDGLAIIDGLNNDAPIGTLLDFGNMRSGVLVWRRDDNICFALLLQPQDRVSPGDSVSCVIKGILQVVDSTLGPITQREWALSTVATSDELVGRVIDWQGRLHGSDQPVCGSQPVPLMNTQLEMDEREQIAEALTTGLRGFDYLTPLGRGQAQLITGPASSGKSLAALDMILGQVGTGVRCVYACVKQSDEVRRKAIQRLEAGGALEYTTVVAASQGASLGEQYGTLCAALSIAERTRDAGGHSLVVLDDVSCMPDLWDRITDELTQLDPIEGLVNMTEGGGGATTADPSIAAAEGREADDSAQLGNSTGPSQEQLVEYEGVLISAAAAQRRRFFSLLIQRAAKAHRDRGGGSLTLVMVLPGSPATGASQIQMEPSRYKHLTEAQRQKLEAALTDRQQESVTEQNTDCVRTEVVEEFMSIADGQTVLTASPDVSQGVVVDARLSVSRIGNRAFPPEFGVTASQLRFQLAQAADLKRFGVGQKLQGDLNEMAHASVVAAALLQPPGQPIQLVQEVIEVFALTSGLLDDIPSTDVRRFLDTAVVEVRRRMSDAEIISGKSLTADVTANLLVLLQSLKQ